MLIETVRVRRLDNGRELVVAVSDLLYWIRKAKPSAKFAMMRRQPNLGDVEYIRESPSSIWCVRVAILERLDGGSGPDPDCELDLQEICDLNAELVRLTALVIARRDTKPVTGDGNLIIRQAGATPLDPPPPPSRLALAFRSALQTVPAALLLALLVVGPAFGAGLYKRPTWADSGGGCLNTREKALIAQCKAVGRSEDGCRITWAACVDSYTGLEVSTDSPAQAIHVDHLYPTAEAWKRRAWKAEDGRWCERADRCEEFERFFNDTRNLVVVRARTNLRKSDLMPDGWCPYDPKARPWAARKLREIAKAWRLPVLAAEEVGLQAWERGECAPGAKVLGAEVGP